MTFKHIAIIPDGTRRYCRLNKIPFKQGYELGKNKLLEILNHITDKYPFCKYVSCFFMSYDNINNRSNEEIEILFDVLLKFIEKVSNNTNYRWRFITTDINKIKKNVLEKIIEFEQNTQCNDNICINIFFAYSSQKIIVNCVNNLIKQKKEVTEENIQNELTKSITYYDYNMPNPDCVIRTSETRLSDFMLYELAYSEIYFIPKYFPELTLQDIDNCVELYYKTEKRYGK